MGAVGEVEVSGLDKDLMDLILVLIRVLRYLLAALIVNEEL